MNATGLLLWLGGNALIALPLAAVAMTLDRIGRARPAVCHQAWLLVVLVLVMPPLPLPWSPRTRLLDRVNAPDPVAVSLIPANDVRPRATTPFVVDAPRMAKAAPREVSRPVPGTTARPAIAQDLVLLLWGLGALAMAILQTRRVLASRRLIRDAESAPRHLHDAVTRIAARIGVSPPAVLLVPGLGCPAVTTLGRARLLWPRDAVDGPPEETVIAHELAHLRRRDPWALLLEMAASVLCWWNPVFWMARRRVHDLAEICCDAWATWAFPHRRRRYAEALLSSLERTLAGPTTQVAIGAVSRDRRALERRLRMVMDEKNARARRGSLVMVGLILVGGALTAPSWSEVLVSSGLAEESLRERAERLFREGRFEEAAVAFRALADSGPAVAPGDAAAWVTAARAPSVAQVGTRSAAPAFPSRGAATVGSETVAWAAPHDGESVPARQLVPAPVAKAARSLSVAAVCAEEVPTADASSPFRAPRVRVASQPDMPSPPAPPTPLEPRSARVAPPPPDAPLPPEPPEPLPWPVEPSAPEPAPSDDAAEWCSLGERSLQQGEYALAVEAYTRALELRPDDTTALVRLAQVYLSLGQPDRALSLLKRAQPTPDAPPRRGGR